MDRDVMDPAPIALDHEAKAMEAPGAHADELRLWLRLLTCSTMIEGEIRKRLRERFGVTLPRFDLMAQLDRASEGMTLSDLSRRMMVSNGNLTGLVERLVESGHLDRRTAEYDRRAQVISLTELGRADFDLAHVVYWRNGELEAMIADDVCLIGFTSGTTGEPKGTMHFHRDMLAICETYARHVLRAEPDDRPATIHAVAAISGLSAISAFFSFSSARLSIWRTRSFEMPSLSPSDSSVA